MNKRNFIILITLLCCCTTLLASTWRVNNSPSVNADFNNLETALQSEQVLAGDTLYVESSPYVYDINDIVKKVTLIGPGYYLTQNPNTQENKAVAMVKVTSTSGLYILAAGVRCEGITFDNNYLYICADNITLKRCYANYIYWGNKTAGAQVVKNSVITQCITDNIEGNTTSNDYPDGALITNNITKGISYVYNAVIEHNTCIGGSIRQTNGNGSIRHNVMLYALVAGENGTMTIDNNYKYESTDFVSASSSPDGKYQLSSSSSLKTKGPDGKEVGAFGGSSPYILSGLPNVPHIYEIIAPVSASAVSGLDVTVKIATEK